MTRTRPPAPEPLPLGVMDNHAHLDIARGSHAQRELDEVAPWLAEAAAVGVTRVVTVGCDLPAARWTVRALDEYPTLLGGVAIHPNVAPHLTATERQAAYAEIESLARHPQVVTVSETGLDYFRTPEEGRAAQTEAFRWHIDLAKRLGKALQIHDRDAHDDVIRVLDEEGVPERTVMHCFSGGPELARACADRGIVASFAGTVTFTSAQPLREALSVLPLDLVQVETDAPYLAPHPHRGADNASYLIPVTVRAMAAVRNVSVAELCEQLSATSTRLYGAPRG